MKSEIRTYAVKRERKIIFYVEASNREEALTRAKSILVIEGASLQVLDQVNVHVLRHKRTFTRFFSRNYFHPMENEIEDFSQFQEASEY